MPLRRAAGARLRVIKIAEMSARLHLPDNGVDAGPFGALLWIHGGGYVMGHPRQDDALCSMIAATLGIVVLAPQYRLAPRHRFPAALDDCRTAWDFLRHAAADLGVDPTRMAIGGDSAGGGLAACLVQSLAHEQPGSVAAQWLWEPMLDDRTGCTGDMNDLPEYLWKSVDNRYAWAAYLGLPAGAAGLPRYAVAAACDNLRGLPPTWIGVGTADLFRAEDLAYAHSLTRAGCDVEFFEVPDVPHGFALLAPKTAPARRFRQAAMDWLRTAVAA